VSHRTRDRTPLAVRNIHEIPHARMRARTRACTRLPNKKGRPDADAESILRRVWSTKVSPLVRGSARTRPHIPRQLRASQAAQRGVISEIRRAA